MSDRRVITYGLSANADVRAINLRHEKGQMIFDVLLSDRLDIKIDRLDNVQFPMLGEHNVQNCLAAISICLEMAIDPEIILSGLRQFKGVGRRFDFKGETDGITIIDDYGHHPVEIRAALSAGRMQAEQNKLIAVVQPHRYSRLRDLFSDFCACFNDADHVVVADVYAAGEDPIEGFEKEDLPKGCAPGDIRSIHVLSGLEALAEQIDKLASSGDLVMCLGAGTVTAWAAALPEQLAKLRNTLL